MPLAADGITLSPYDSFHFGQRYASSFSFHCDEGIVVATDAGQSHYFSQLFTRLAESHDADYGHDFITPAEPPLAVRYYAAVGHDTRRHR